MDSDSSRPLGDLGTLLQSIVNSFDGIILGGQKEAAGHLWAVCSRVEKCRGRVCKVLLRHEIVRLLDSRNVVSVNPDGDTHEHVLWRFSQKEVPPLECFDSKVSEIVVSRRLDPRVHLKMDVLHKLV